MVSSGDRRRQKAALWLAMVRPLGRLRILVGMGVGIMSPGAWRVCSLNGPHPARDRMAEDAFPGRTR